MIDLVTAAADLLLAEIGPDAAEPVLLEVGTTTDLQGGLEELLQRRHRVPAAWVHPVNDRADRNRFGTHQVGQAVVQTIGALLVVGGQSQARTAGAVDALAVPRDALRAVLVGWTPSEDFAPLELVSGEMVQWGGGVGVWLERYRSDYELRATARIVPPEGP